MKNGFSGLPVVVRGEKLQGVVGNGVCVIERFGTVGRIVFRSDVVVARQSVAGS